MSGFRHVVKRWLVRPAGASKGLLLSRLPTVKRVWIYLLAFVIFFGGLFLWKSSRGNSPDNPNLCRHGLFTLPGRLLRGDVWEPTGCAMHCYSPNEVAKCMRSRFGANLTNEFVFMGDSNTRYKAIELAKLLGMGGEQDTNSSSWMKNDSQAMVAFFLNEMLFKREILEAPSLFLFASNLWFNLDNDAFPKYRAEISLGNVTEDEKISVFKRRLHFWAERASKWEKTLVIWCLQDPVYPGFKGVTNKGVSMYNSIAMQELQRYSNIWIWTSARSMVEQMFHAGSTLLRRHGGDFVHLADALNEKEVQTLLNVLCNPFIVDDNRNYCCRQIYN